MDIGFGSQRGTLGMALVLVAPAFGPAQAQEVFDLSDFRRVVVESGMRVEIREGSGFHVEVDGSPDSLDRLEVRREGDRLRFSMDRGSGWLWWLRPWSGGRDVDIRIEMPELTEISLSGGSRGVMHLDRPTDRVQVSLSGGSRIEGTLHAGSMEVSLSGGSRATLAGRTDALGLSASGGSRLDSGDLESGRVRARMSGGSQGTVATSGEIDASLSGGSQLHYHGGSPPRAAASVRAGVAASGGRARGHERHRHE